MPGEDGGSHDWQPINDKRPLAERAAEFLTKRLIAGEWELGEFLPSERELAERLGVGRSTVREAIQMLELHGLVRRRQGVGVEIVDNSQQATAYMFRLMLLKQQVPIEQLVEVRDIIDQQAVALAAQRADDGDLAAMEAAVTTMEDPAVTAREYLDADLGFHMALVRGSRNQILILLLEVVRPLLRDVIGGTLTDDARPELTLHYHRRILTGLRERNTEQARQAVDEHMRTANDLLQSTYDAGRVVSSTP